MCCCDTSGRSVTRHSKARCPTYNGRIMRCWLLALFVLQLVWNTAGVAVVGLGVEHERPAHLTVAASAVDAHATEGKGLIDQAHGLLDELPDLPDSLHRGLQTLPMASPLHTLPLAMHRSKVSHWPFLLFRPPTMA